jgi:nitroreductase
MNAMEAIAQRRSIRKFKDKAIPKGTLEQILKAATQAPSGKNRQPWRFHVVQGDQRAEMVRIMREGIAKLEAEGVNSGSSKWSANIMEQAPVTVFVFNPYVDFDQELKLIGDVLTNIVDVQSAGAAIQNMLLAALELGVGSLWICDVFYAYKELCTWLGQTHQMIAAVALGYPDESPGARPRKTVDEVTVWRS